MRALSLLYRAGLSVSRLAAWIGLLLILAAALLTCADIGLRNVGFRGIIGMVDLTQLFVLAAASLVIPFAFYSQAHVAVDLLTQRLGPRANAAVALASTVLGAALLGLLVVYGWNQAQMSLAAGDRSQTLELPVWLYWAPFLAGNALSAYAASAMVLRHLVHLATGRDPFPQAAVQGLPQGSQ